MMSAGLISHKGMQYQIVAAFLCADPCNEKKDIGCVQKCRKEQKIIAKTMVSATNLVGFSPKFVLFSS